MKSKGLIGEFKEFIAQGNVMDMAVGIIIGAAFTAIVTSLVDNIINPLIVLITGGNGTSMGFLNIQVADGVYIEFGTFIGAIINFLIIALCVFLIVKAFNKFNSMKDNIRGKNGEELKEVAPVCPFCKEEVHEGATRCSHCSSELPEPAKPTFEAA